MKPPDKHTNNPITPTPPLNRTIFGVWLNILWTSFKVWLYNLGRIETIFLRIFWSHNFLLWNHFQYSLKSGCVKELFWFYLGFTWHINRWVVLVKSNQLDRIRHSMLFCVILLINQHMPLFLIIYFSLRELFISIECWLHRIRFQSSKIWHGFLDTNLNLCEKLFHV